MLPGVILFMDVSGGEILVILLAAFLLFGPKKLPDIARQIGKGINELKKATNDIKQEITRETGKLREDIDAFSEDAVKEASDIRKEFQGMEQEINTGREATLPDPYGLEKEPEQAKPAAAAPDPTTGP